MSPDPISPYAVARLASERYMISFYRCYGLETLCLRYFNVFGPRQDPSSPYSGVLARFIMQMLRGEQPTIFGDGEQSRDFTYIDNVVDGNLVAGGAPATQAAGEVFNVATGRRVTLNGTFQVLQSLTSYPASPNTKQSVVGTSDILWLPPRSAVARCRPSPKSPRSTAAASTSAPTTSSSSTPGR